MSGILPPMIIVLFILMITAIWPTIADQMAMFQEILQNPVYRAILGQLGIGDITTFQGFFNIEIFVMLEMIMIFTTIIIPARMVTSEVDKRTLDIVISFPISRWQLLLEKFSVYLIYNLLYPIFMITSTVIANQVLKEEFDYVMLTYATIGTWLLFFALGAISLLCGVIFLEGKKAITAAGTIILGMWVLVRFSGFVDSLDFLKYFSLFHYLNAAAIFKAGTMPLDELFIVIGVGLAALIGALVIFEKRELAIV
ncbi:MAG: ABC transporter permease subunit [Candidatus Heimdallarchaeota archaeon]